MLPGQASASDGALEARQGDHQADVDVVGTGGEACAASMTGNRTMYPLTLDGPYYCAILGPATLDTCGGPVIDTAARVLRLDGSPIPGLFGGGNCIASPAGQAY